jgi:hypothetical protein
VTGLELSLSELRVLCEAIEEWEASPSRDAILSAMLASSLAPSPGGSKQVLQSALALAKKHEAERKDSAILLKAKFIEYRRRIEQQEPVPQKEDRA